MTGEGETGLEIPSGNFSSCKTGAESAASWSMVGVFLVKGDSGLEWRVLGFGSGACPSFGEPGASDFFFFFFSDFGEPKDAASSPVFVVPSDSWCFFSLELLDLLVDLLSRLCSPDLLLLFLSLLLTRGLHDVAEAVTEPWTSPASGSPVSGVSCGV